MPHLQTPDELRETLTAEPDSTGSVTTNIVIFIILIFGMGIIFAFTLIALQPFLQFVITHRQSNLASAIVVGLLLLFSGLSLFIFKRYLWPVLRRFIRPSSRLVGIAFGLIAAAMAIGFFFLLLIEIYNWLTVTSPISFILTRTISVLFPFS